VVKEKMERLRRRNKVWLTFLVACCVVSLWIAEWPQSFSSFLRIWRAQWSDFLYQRRISLVGLHLLDASQVEALLPKERSNLWWLFRAAVIKAGLLSNPLIQQAKVERCNWWSIKCYKVEVLERKAGFFALLGQEGWLIGKDGGLIMPVSAAEIISYRKKGEEGGNSALRSELIPVVRGLWRSAEASSDVVRSRFEYVRRAIDVIEEAAGLKIVYLELGGGKDMTVKFAGLAMKAVFAAQPEGLWSDESPLLRDRALRLRRLIQELGPEIEQVESVDLGFEKIAVLRTRKGG